MNSVELPSKGITATKQKVHIETWGCQMNIADSERMLSLLQGENFELSSDGPENADLILLNTCHIREKARHKVLSRLGVLDRLKINNPKLKIAVTGCVAQADGKKLLELAPQVDVLLGPGKIENLPSLIEENKRTGHQVFAIGFDRHKVEISEVQSSSDLNTLNIPSVSGKKEITRFVNIIQGCNNFCTFCVVPFTRGREISRPQSDILREVKYLVDQGAKEITFLGQNVNSYGLDFLGTEIVPEDGGPFVQLLRSASKIDGLERIRFTTSNPHDFTESLAQLFASTPKLGRHIHLPVQSGSNKILELMKRKVTREDYIKRVNWLRKSVPGIEFSTDIIVGFPGETEEDFQETLSLLKEVQYSFVYAFNYSPRRGTAASRFTDHVLESVKDERLNRLNKLQDEITLKLALNEVGQTKEVLFIYQSRKDPLIWVGKTQEYRTVRVTSAMNLLGRTLPVKIESGNKVAMLGNLI